MFMSFLFEAQELEFHKQKDEFRQNRNILTAVTSGAGGGESSRSVSEETCPIPGERLRPIILTIFFSFNECQWEKNF